MDFNSLTAEEKEKIRKEILEEEKQKEIKRKEKIKEYKGIVDETVRENFNKVEKLAEILKNTKLEIFRSFRVLELEAIANENGNETLLEGVKIIKEAYKPSKSSTYIEAYYKDKTGRMISVPLSITSVIEEKNGEDKERTN